MADRYEEKARIIVSEWSGDIPSRRGMDVLVGRIASALRDQDTWYEIDDPEHPAPRDGMSPPTGGRFPSRPSPPSPKESPVGERPKPGDIVDATDMQCILVPVEDYRRLLESTESDGMIVSCETCGAWLDRDDPACASTDDYTGCWKVATRRDCDAHLCRSYRVLELANAPSPAAGEER